MSCAAKQWKHCSQLTTGSVTHTGATVRFKQEHKHTHAQSVRDSYKSVTQTHTYKDRIAARVRGLNTELCIHSFRDKRKGRSQWKRKKEAEENSRELRGRLKHTHTHTHTHTHSLTDRHTHKNTHKHCSVCQN